MSNREIVPPGLCPSKPAGDFAVDFNALYRELQPALLRYLRAVEPEAAEDIASDTWLEVTRGLATFSGDERALRGWLFTIARHRLIDARRWAARHRRAPLSWLADRPGVDDPAAAVLIDLSTHESLRLVAELPRDQGQAVILRVMVGLDTDQVAEILGKQPGNVRVLSHRGLRNLAQRLAQGAAGDRR